MSYNIVSDFFSSINLKDLMAWRSIAGRATNQMLSSWTFAGRDPAAVWRGQSSCNLTKDALQDAFTQVTTRQVRQLQAVIDGHRTHDINLLLADGMFNTHQDILTPLRNSNFISYRFGPNQHFCSYVKEQGLWVPLQAWEGVINLSDWIKTFDDSGGMEAALTKMAQTIKTNPIDSPKTYWTYFWNQFIAKFNSTQILDVALAQIKQQRLQAIQNAYLEFNVDQRNITWIFCDGQ